MHATLVCWPCLALLPLPDRTRLMAVYLALFSWTSFQEIMGTFDVYHHLIERAQLLMFFIERKWIPSTNQGLMMSITAEDFEVSTGTFCTIVLFLPHSDQFYRIPYYQCYFLVSEIMNKTVISVWICFGSWIINRGFCH